MVTDLVGAGARLFAALELIGGEPRLWHLAVAQAVGGTASAFQAPTISPLIAGTVDASGLQRANSLMGAANGATRLAGPALAGTFVLTIGPGWTFLPDAASFAASAALLAMTRVRHVPPLVIGAYGLALTGLGVLNPTWETVVQMSIPPQALARVTSHDWLLSLAAAPLGYALAPRGRVQLERVRATLDRGRPGRRVLPRHRRGARRPPPDHARTNPASGVPLEPPTPQPPVDGPTTDRPVAEDCPGHALGPAEEASTTWRGWWPTASRPTGSSAAAHRPPTGPDASAALSGGRPWQATAGADERDTAPTLGRPRDAAGAPRRSSWVSWGAAGSLRPRRRGRR
ncbi:MFS transporter [Actinomadura madurae]|nr:MFS transporter [Actinomadura madurae]URN01691.1 MFS transporter [Actinomadura madurae]URN10790.1 MFS transporter [Actinomadura madurae]